MTTNKPKSFTACDLSAGRSEGESMTDRGLLELAAKAAGINIFDWTPGGRPTANGSWDGIWNPLANDGDALRLAVDLRIDVYPWIEDSTSSAMARNGHGFRAIEFASKNRGCKYAATRRAIVRAAAEIGKEVMRDT